MNLGEAYTLILDYLAGQELPADVAKAKKRLEGKADRLSRQQRARKLATLCACKQHHKSGGLVVCNECWRSAPYELRQGLTHAPNHEAFRAAHRALYEFALSRQTETTEAAA